MQKMVFCDVKKWHDIVFFSFVFVFLFLFLWFVVIMTGTLILYQNPIKLIYRIVRFVTYFIFVDLVQRIEVNGHQYCT